MPHRPFTVLLPAMALIGSGMGGQLAAMDAYIVGPRAQGMGGTGVASSTAPRRAAHGP